MKRVIISLLVLFLCFQLVSAAHFIVGEVKNALDGTNANGRTAVLWRTAGGMLDNMTDIIGVSGNSGTDNYYMFDCELLNTPCNIGDEVNVKVFDDGSGHTTAVASKLVTGAGFDSMASRTLNSPPNVSLVFPSSGTNYSNSTINLSCSASDLDGDLANLMLYGNWTGWHKNQTRSIGGNSVLANFTTLLEDGRYFWNCLVNDSLDVKRFASYNWSFTIDTTPPNISEVSTNLTLACGTTYNVRVNCTADDSLTMVQTVVIQALSPSGYQNYTTQLLSGKTYYADILLDEVGIFPVWLMIV